MRSPKLTAEQVEAAQRLVDGGYRLADVARRFGVTSATLNNYGVHVAAAKRGVTRASRTRPRGVSESRGAGEPTFDEYVAARRVIVFVRRELAAEGRPRARGADALSLGNSDIFAEIVMRSSPFFNPAHFTAPPSSLDPALVLASSSAVQEAAPAP